LSSDAVAVNTYFLKPGYRENNNPEVYRDSPERAQMYQVDVYRHAGEIARSPGIASVLDVGCGLATKLVEYVWPHCHDITGVDDASTIKLCRAMHSVGRWIPGDLEDPGFGLDATYDLIIAADVVEHLLDPDRLLQLIRASCHNATRVVISTPERDRRRGEADMGPPGNGAHVREWNQAEFSAYLQSRGFVIEESRIVDLCEGMKTCQMVVGGFR
jgi:2-polyprenyl-6-hydroxyphenyl methylase/3-demethylubiquinone-9 3-methyltransferase